jgi:hypothetical protein
LLRADFYLRALIGMHEVLVTHTFRASADQVFAGVTDHVAFLSTSHIRCRLLKTGEADANGLGAFREVRSGIFRFEEEITAFTAPHAYEYRIRCLRGPFGVKLPFQHAFGGIELRVTNSSTEAIWASHFHFPIPILGEWLDRKLGESISATFLFFLKRLDQRLQTNP